MVQSLNSPKRRYSVTLLDGKMVKSMDYGFTQMTREEFLLELDTVFELPAGTLKGQDKLEELEQWR